MAQINFYVAFYYQEKPRLEKKKKRKTKTGFLRRAKTTLSKQTAWCKRDLDLKKGILKPGGEKNQHLPVFPLPAQRTKGEESFLVLPPLGLPMTCSFLRIIIISKSILKRQLCTRAICVSCKPN